MQLLFLLVSVSESDRNTFVFFLVPLLVVATEKLMRVKGRNITFNKYKDLNLQLERVNSP